MLEKLIFGMEDDLQVLDRCFPPHQFTSCPYSLNIFAGHKGEGRQGQCSSTHISSKRFTMHLWKLLLPPLPPFARPPKETLLLFSCPLRSSLRLLLESASARAIQQPRMLLFPSLPLRLLCLPPGANFESLFFIYYVCIINTKNTNLTTRLSRESQKYCSTMVPHIGSTSVAAFGQKCRNLSATHAQKFL
jgi:hypothetical protein